MTAPPTTGGRRPWLKAILWIVIAGLAVAIAIGTGVSIVMWRHTSITKPAAADAEASFTAVRERFKGRQPLVEVKEPGPVMVDVRVNRPPATAPRQPVKHFQVIVWDSRGGTFIRSSAPVWWMNFSGNNLLARLGVPLGDFTLTVADVERYGPGIVIDFMPPGGGHMLVWVE
jgi:hypothetical protein